LKSACLKGETQGKLHLARSPGSDWTRVDCRNDRRRDKTGESLPKQLAISFVRNKEECLITCDRSAEAPLQIDSDGIPADAG